MTISRQSIMTILDILGAHHIPSAASGPLPGDIIMDHEAIINAVYAVGEADDMTLADSEWQDNIRMTLGAWRVGAARMRLTDAVAAIDAALAS